MKFVSPKNWIRLAAATTLAGIAGCTVGPNYHKPEYAVPETFGETLTPATQPATRPAAELVNWWTGFNDPILSSLMDRAVEKNLDLRLATQRILEARAARGYAIADFGPVVNANGAYSRSRRSLETGGASQNQTSTGGTVGNGGNGGTNGRGFQREFNQYDLGFDSTWEVDIFGGVARGVESANAALQSVVESRRDVLVSVTAEVARNYIELRGYQREVRIVRNNLETQKQTLELTRTRFKAGLSSDLDVARAEAQVYTTESSLPPLEQQARVSIHALGILLGSSPLTLAPELEPERGIPMAETRLALGVPSDLLRRRPDIRAAERNLQAASANIGVATADLFPRFTLTGSYGLQAQQFNSLFNESALTWVISPGFTWRIWDWGKIRSNIRIQTARQEQVLTQYQQAVLNALNEVENALVALDKEQIRRQSLLNAASSNRRAVNLAQQLYSRGLTDFLNVLETQRQLLATEDSLTQSERTVSTNLVQLYKVLGGGWSDSAPMDYVRTEGVPFMP